MATSGTVASGDLATAQQYNDLRTDVLSTHIHDGTDGSAALGGVVGKGLTQARVRSSGLLVNNPANTFNYTVVASAILANRNITLPLLSADDTFAFLGVANVFSAVQAVTDTTDATSGSTGSIHTAGGLGVTKALYAGTTLTVIGSTGLAGAVVAGKAVGIGGDGSATFTGTNVDAGNTTGLYTRFASITSAAGNTGSITVATIYGGTLTVTDGVHAEAATLELRGATKAGGGIITSGATLLISAAFTGAGTNNYAVWVQAGVSLFAGHMFFSGLSAAGAGTALVITGGNEMIPLASARQFKDGIADLADTGRIYDLQPRRFTWNERTATPGVQDIGLVADEVAAVWPDLVTYRAGEPWAVKYDRLAVPMLAELKLLRDRVADLEAQLAWRAASCGAPGAGQTKPAA